MQTDNSKDPEEETKEFQAWVQKTYGDAQNVPNDVLLLILYKLHLLEEKIDRIDEHTRSHWAN